MHIYIYRYFSYGNTHSKRDKMDYCLDFHTADFFEEILRKYRSIDDSIRNVWDGQYKC